MRQLGCPEIRHFHKPQLLNLAQLQIHHQRATLSHIWAEKCEYRLASKKKNLQSQHIICPYNCTMNKKAPWVSPAADEHIPAGKAQTSDSVNWMCPFKSTGSRSDAQLEPSLSVLEKLSVITPASNSYTYKWLTYSCFFTGYKSLYFVVMLRAWH